MAQFDVYQNPNPSTRQRVPYVVDLQNDLLDGLATRVVAPLVAGASAPITGLQPVLRFEGREWLLSTAEMAGIPTRALGAKVGSVAGERETIIAAIDLLFTGI